MIQRAEEANIDAPMKRGPGGALLERLKGGIVGEFFNWAKRNSTWPLHFGIMCCAIEMAATSDPRYDAERFGIIYRSSPRQCDVLLLNGPLSLKLSAKIKAERTGWVKTRKGRLVSAREGQLMDMQKGEYTYEVPQVRT